MRINISFDLEVPASFVEQDEIDSWFYDAIADLTSDIRSDKNVRNISIDY